MHPGQNFYFYPAPGDRAVDLALFQQDEAGTPGAIGYFVLDDTGRLWAGGNADPAVAAAGSIQPPLNGVTQRAVDVVLADDTGQSGWIMDNMGTVHAFGAAAEALFPAGDRDDWVALQYVRGQLLRVDARGGMSWSGTGVAGWDLPRVDGGLLVDVEVEPGRGLVALDRMGALYSSGQAVRPQPGQGPPYLGMAAARDLEIVVRPASGGMLPRKLDYRGPGWDRPAGGK